MDDDAGILLKSLCENVCESSEVCVPNMIRCPFYEKPVDHKCAGARNIRRTQRHRSTAQSRLGDMTVGDIPYCFQQLRNAGTYLSPEMILYNGQSAGEFALKYLRETSSALRKRRKRVALADKKCDEDAGIESNIVSAKRIGMYAGASCVNDENVGMMTSNVLEFERRVYLSLVCSTRSREVVCLVILAFGFSRIVYVSNRTASSFLASTTLPLYWAPSVPGRAADDLTFISSRFVSDVCFPMEAKGLTGLENPR